MFLLSTWKFQYLWLWASSKNQLSKKYPSKTSSKGLFVPHRIEPPKQGLRELLEWVTNVNFGRFEPSGCPRRCSHVSCFGFGGLSWNSFEKSLPGYGAFWKAYGHVLAANRSGKFDVWGRWSHISIFRFSNFSWKPLEKSLEAYGPVLRAFEPCWRLFGAANANGRFDVWRQNQHTSNLRLHQFSWNLREEALEAYVAILKAYATVLLALWSG